jgi:hypothetical protein
MAVFHEDIVIYERHDQVDHRTNEYPDDLHLPLGIRRIQLSAVDKENTAHRQQ